MNLANWTTRILVGGAKDAAATPDADAHSSDESADASTPETQSFVGRRVGAYLVTKRLGTGGVGEVFKAVDVMLKRDVAIKVLRDELAADSVFLARFRNEAQLQAKLSHPNVAAVHAFLQEGDKQLIVMEYVAGVSLDEFVRSGGPVPAQRALEIFRRALDGIDHAHGHGIVHRDIKPANIMLADNGQVKVMDFGIARAMDSQEHLTRIGHVAGTAKAMSPEQIRGKQADERSDIYSLGIVLYTMLAGRAPFDSGNDLELMKAQLEQTPPPLRGILGSVPPKVEAAVMRALEKDPSARFQTVRDFARAIDACINELAVRPAPIADRSMDSPTASRTAINPVLQGVKRLPTAANPAREELAAPVARASSPQWMRLGAIALGIAALAGSGVLLWSQFPPTDQRSELPPPPVTATTKVSPVSPVAPPGDGQSNRLVAPSPEPAPAPVAQAAAPILPLTTAPAVQSQAASAPIAQAAAPTPPLTLAPAVQSPPVTALSTEPVRAPNLAIVRLPSNTKGAEQAALSDDRFQPGERIRLLVKSSQDAHVYCYLQDKSQSIQRFYPNRFNTSSLVKAGEPVEIPGKMRFELVADSLKATETIACFASERDPASKLPASVVGEDFAKLPVGSLEEVRTAFGRASAGGLAESRFQIEVR